MANVIGLLVWIIGYLLLVYNYADFHLGTALWMLGLGMLEAMVVGTVKGIQEGSRY